MKRFFTAVLALLFTSVVVLTVSFAMSMDAHGNMVDCPYTEDGSSMCAMTGLEHLAQWKMNFLGLKQSQNLLAISGLVVLLFVWIGFSVKEVQELEMVKLKWRQKKNDILKGTDAFLELFSSGILHSKVYERA